MPNKIHDEDLLSLVLSGKSQTEIAKTLHCTKATVCRRIHTKAFSDMLSEHRKKRIDTALTSLTDCVPKAVETLKDLLDSENDFVRLNACKSIITESQDYSLHTDLMRDIEEIKQFQKEQEI